MSQDEDLCKVNVIFTVSGTLSHFNTGSASKVALLNQLNIESSRKISSTVRTEDHKLTIIAAKKNQKNLECVGESYMLKNYWKIFYRKAYQAGNFGLPKKTEDITKISYIKKAKKPAKIVLDFLINAFC